MRNSGINSGFSASSGITGRLYDAVIFSFVFKMKERAIQTLGYFPVGDEDFPHQKLLLQGLMDSVEVRHYQCIILYTTVSISLWTLFMYSRVRFEKGANFL